MILEAVGQLVPDLIVHRAGDAEAARLGQGLQARGHVDAVAVVVTIRLRHHIPDIDAEAQTEPALRRQPGVALEHGALDPDGAGDGPDRAGELGQQAVAHRLDEAPVRRRDGGVQNLPAQGLEAAQRSGLVRAHEPAVAHDIADQDRGETAFGAALVPVSTLRG